jgi:hypothetical protein
MWDDISHFALFSYDTLSNIYGLASMSKKNVNVLFVVTIETSVHAQ